MSHNLVQHITTTLVLELLDMNIIGPMQVESLKGKRYVFVCDEGYSIYT